MSWRTAFVCHGLDQNGRRVPILVGIVRIGRQQRIALSIDDEHAVILPDQTPGELIANLRTAVAELHRSA